VGPLCSSAVSDPQISANDGPKLTPAAAIARPFNPRIRHKLDQPSFQYLGADSPRSSNPHRTCERRQRLFLNAVSSLGGFPTPASSCLAPPRARGRRPKPFTIADGRHQRLNVRDRRQADVEKGGDECCWAETGLTEVTSGRTGIRAIAVPLRGRNILHRTKMNSRADRQQPPHRRVDHHWAWKYGADRDTIFCALGGRVPRFCILLPLTRDRR
jgi:hypothetical protein